MPEVLALLFLVYVLCHRTGYKGDRKPPPKGGLT